MVNIVKKFLIMLSNLQFKTASKRAIQNTAEANGDLISNKIADIISEMKKNSKQSQIIWKYSQMSMIKKFLKKDMYL